MKDYLIIGQGIAGSMLAFELFQRNKKVDIVDNSHQGSSSIMSAGIINPITGKRFAITKDFFHFFLSAQQKYKELEKLFAQKFFEQKPILRLFQNEKEKEHWLRKEKKEDILAFQCQRYKAGEFAPLLQDHLGSLRVAQSGFCHGRRLLAVLREYFVREKILDLSHFQHDELKIRESDIHFRGETYRSVIFCEGYQAQFNPFFNWLPFNSVKGEILKVALDSKGLEDAVINKGKWLAPQADGYFSAGASYIWDALDCLPTQAARDEIIKGISSIITRKVDVVDHSAGVRPVMADQKVVMGRHFDHPGLAIFNGLGSKGFLTAPAYAKHFADHLEGFCELDETVSINRFSNYPAHHAAHAAP